MTITGYATDEGYSRTIREAKLLPVEYLAPGFMGELPVYEEIVQTR